MTVRTSSCVLVGLEAHRVDVEVDVAGGLPQFAIVGLAGGAVRESKDRVRAALRNAEFTIPERKITVNLAPAHLRKEGTSFDLAIALALLAAIGTLPPEAVRDLGALGELSLDGSVRPGSGTFPMALALARVGLRKLVVPAGNAAEAALAEGLEVYGVKTLGELVGWLRDGRPLAACQVNARELLLRESPSSGADFAEVRGQAMARRALEVAAAGGHNLLLIGPPGAGKTMLARRLPGILPPLRLEEALEATAIHSVAGCLGDHPLVVKPPFRAPHHTISEAGLIGGGTRLRPGEVALAHRGVLFLDELPEFAPHTLEALRQPLEEREVVVTRVHGTCVYPADAIVVAAMNPCPCGHAGDPVHECSCAPGAARRYRQRISGPLLDRIDLHVEVPALPYRELAQGEAGEDSAAIRARVAQARRLQARRFRRPGVRTNGRMNGREIDRHCVLGAVGERLLEESVTKLGLSARAYSRVLRVARTIADLAGVVAIEPAHLAEALQYRALDRRMMG